MIRLTPELWLHSAFSGDSDQLETRELDFNLSRRSGVVINRIVSQCEMHVDTLTGNDPQQIMIQEVDVDPDNVDVEFQGVVLPDDVVMDSSRVLRHYMYSNRDTATGGGDEGNHPLLIKDWHALPMELRPISITSIRHHIVGNADISCIYHGEINIDYYIVELTLQELGIINASRR